jgi:hypothetical protein
VPAVRLDSATGLAGTLGALFLLLSTLCLLAVLLSLGVLFVLLLLRVSRGSGSDKQEQNCSADNSNWFHKCCPVTTPSAIRLPLNLWQATGHFTYTLAEIRCQSPTAHTCG